MLRYVTEKRPDTPSPNHGDGGVTPHAAPPPGVDPQSWFLSVDTDRSGYITPTELQTALRNGGWPPFEVDSIKYIMSIFDPDRNGAIDINKFDGLWKYIKDWEGQFRLFDKNKDNTIDGDEMQEGLERLGYRLSPPLQNLLIRKYNVNLTTANDGPAAAGRSTSPAITFDRFIRACALLKQLKESVEALDRDPLGRFTIDYDTFMRIFLRLP